MMLLSGKFEDSPACPLSFTKQKNPKHQPISPPAKMSKARRNGGESVSSPSASSSSSSSSSTTTGSAGTKRKRTKSNAGRSSRGVVAAKGSYDDSDDSDEEESTAPHEVVFFGDSLTHGMAHNRADRYAVTWPTMLIDKFKKHDLHVVECAMCSRTTRFDDINLDNSDWLPHAKPEYFNGHKALIPQLLSHSPHWLVLLLGTNDLQSGIQDQYDEERVKRLGVKGHSPTPFQRAEEIAESVAVLACDAQTHVDNLRIVLVTPPPVRLTEDNEDWGFTEDSVTISYLFPEAFRRVCRRYGFLNTNPPSGTGEGQIDMAGSEDGVHITEEHNEIIAKAVWDCMALEEKSDARPLRRRRPAKPYYARN